MKSRGMCDERVQAATLCSFFSDSPACRTRALSPASSWGDTSQGHRGPVGEDCLPPVGSVPGCQVSVNGTYQEAL